MSKIKVEGLVSGEGFCLFPRRIVAASSRGDGCYVLTWQKGQMGTEVLNQFPLVLL
jgi:hypothetical protein